MSDSQKHLWEVFHRLVGGEPELRTTRQNIMAMAQAGSTGSMSPKELAELISSDPVLATQVLRLVNSAAFGLRHEVTQLLQAISLLGQAQIRDVILSIKIMDKVSRGQETHVMRLWKHSFYTAKVAELIGKTIGKYSGEAFTLGLLHDLGKIVLCHRNEPAFSATIGDYKYNQGRTPHWSSETKVLKINHAELGGMAATLWQLPPFLSTVIWRHHSPSAGKLNTPEEYLIQIINIADIFCWRAGYPSIDGATLTRIESSGFVFPKSCLFL